MIGWPQLNLHDVRGSLGLLQHDRTVMWKTLGVTMQWVDEMFKLVKHRVPFTCQDTRKGAFITERHNTLVHLALSDFMFTLYHSSRAKTTLLNSFISPDLPSCLSL
jgi:hypothetical protein